MTNTRVNEIDLLRFLAAVAVVLFHYTFMGYARGMIAMPYPLLAPVFKYGYLGVQLFFMISGFVILMTASNGCAKGFVVSRLIRLYPAFWACCTLTFITMLAFGAPRYVASLSQYLVNMTMISEFVKVPAIDGSYWSLLVEIRFYALVFLVLLAGRIHQAQLFLIIWLLVSIALEIVPLYKLRYLLVVDYSAYFIAGATFYLVWSKSISLTRIAVIIVSWCLAIYQSFKGFSAFEKDMGISLNTAINTGILTGFFLVFALISLRCTGFFGRKRYLLMGALTYPLYLLHQKIGFIVFNHLYPQINPSYFAMGYSGFNFRAFLFG